MSAATIPHTCEARCITDPADGSQIHVERIGEAGGVEVFATNDDTGPRVRFDDSSAGDLNRCQTIRLAALLLTAAARFEGPSAR